MNKLNFWKQKLIQAFHDPPAKPYAFFPGTGGHLALAKKLLKHFTGLEFTYYDHRPDWAAAGADRPVLNPHKGKKHLIWFHRDGNSVVTHPLAQAGLLLRLRPSTSVEPKTLKEVKELIDHAEDALDGLGAVAESASSPEEESPEKRGLVDWNDAESLQKGFVILWRRYREKLAAAVPEEQLLWERMPADSRSPDHSIWEHSKVASALAFLTDRKRNPAIDQEPWLFSFSLHPVQSFIEESRTSRDLWVSSFLIADLASHAMLPIIERYGPDAVIYPDLRGNTRVDNWLHDHHPEALPQGRGYPATYAALLPNTFTAILPGGGGEYLKPIEEVAAQCAQRVEERWHNLELTVRRANILKASGWEGIWERQLKAVFSSYWTAVHWQIPERIEGETYDAQALEFMRLTEGGALPAQDREKLPRPSEAALKSAGQRKERLAVWMSGDVWTHYERARSVFGRVNLNYLQNERGFDYALTHHELRTRHKQRKQEARYALDQEEPGEKCTQCRRREALRDATKAFKNIGDLRNQVGRFWEQVWKGQGESDRTDRLCGVCAFKRFLVEAGGKDAGLNPLFRDPSAPVEYEDGKVRAPFASTSALAAQEYLAVISTSRDQNVQAALERVITAHRRAGLKPTHFAHALPRLRDAAASSELANRFLKLDPEETIFPDAIQSSIDRTKQAKDPSKERLLSKLQLEIQKLRETVQGIEKDQRIDPPDTHFAVVKLDGDDMGRLLLGAADKIGARWRDVIHPRVVSQLESGIDEMKQAGWPALLDAPRLMGPSLHAFISRALADFAHRIVPWVVEQEYGGCLVYTGGDDVLALAPARDALPMAARLQQLFSAAWIIDTNPGIQPWEWRNDRGIKFDPQAARLRFAIPRPVKLEAVEEGRPLNAIQLPLKPETLASPVSPTTILLSDVSEEQSQVVAGLGPHQSLSASILYGHFKTPLALMLREARSLLSRAKEYGKTHGWRGAVGLSHRSRSGPKSQIVLPWSSRAATKIGGEAIRSGMEPQEGPAPDAHEIVAHIVDGFKHKPPRLARRLPYKLREVAPLLLVEPKWSERLPRGFLVRANDRPLDEDLTRAALTLWRLGYELHVEPEMRSEQRREQGRQSGQEGDQAWSDPAKERRKKRAAGRSIEGLLLCRYLAGQGTEE